jgi:hypothetical protein
LTNFARARITRAVASFWLPLFAAPLLGAQVLRTPDSLLAAGNLARAESAYYAAARVRPRDPVARWALGRFLVERGATRVGVTLLEESLQFGGDPVLVGRELARAYLTIGEFAPLAALPAASPAQRERARWLTTHEPRVIAPDSLIVVPLARSDDSTAVGAIAARVNGVSLVLSLSSQAQGIVVSRAAMGNHHLRPFAAGTDSTANVDLLAVADSVNLGRLTMLNQPVMLATLPQGTQGLIGLSALGRFAPAADGKTGSLTLRPDGTVGADQGIVSGDRLPTLDLPTGISVLRSGAWIASPAELARLLRNRGWVFDAKRGALVVEK